MIIRNKREFQKAVTRLYPGKTVLIVTIKRGLHKVIVRG
jgi:hypothetical protein